MRSLIVTLLAVCSTAAFAAAPLVPCKNVTPGCFESPQGVVTDPPNIVVLIWATAEAHAEYAERAKPYAAACGLAERCVIFRSRAIVPLFFRTRSGAREWLDANDIPAARIVAVLRYDPLAWTVAQSTEQRTRTVTESETVTQWQEETP